ncbi:MAG: hypothetical protein LIO57_01675 [Oscillospiraceae bacterium]|nr:hypothetical protein [Oscillospiraceae bacterium]
MDEELLQLQQKDWTIGVKKDNFEIMLFLMKRFSEELLGKKGFKATVVSDPEAPSVMFTFEFPE